MAEAWRADLHGGTLPIFWPSPICACSTVRPIWSRRPQAVPPPYISRTRARQTFEAGHIPGADFLDLQAEFSDPATALRFMMPPMSAQLESCVRSPRHFSQQPGGALFDRDARCGRRGSGGCCTRSASRASRFSTAASTSGPPRDATIETGLAEAAIRRRRFRRVRGGECSSTSTTCSPRTSPSAAP